ncbi:MAG: acyltransferase family protein [Lachnospiraceae bacterium]|nr:acyltransferase family protein [Lachnospiraceae bacterium]MDD7628485.1 acyltransferase family protein [Lachnospiraceae bacterium]MDY4120011.1 acyltransferase family protein [Lachnospiraceae bacterium]
MVKDGAIEQFCEKDNIITKVIRKLKMERENWIDISKGIGIILVLLGHAGPPFDNKYIYGFHMAIFWIVMGYCYNPKKYSNSNYVTYIRKRYSGLIVPYFGYTVINLFIYGIIIGLFTYGICDEYFLMIGKYVIGILIGGNWQNICMLPNCSPLWFLPAAFLASIIFHGIMALPKYLYYIIIGACVIVSSINSLNGFIWLPWNFWASILAIPFLAVGFDIKQYKIITRINLPCSVLLCFVGMLAIFLNPCEVSFGAVELGNIFLFFVGAIGMTIGIMGISKWMHHCIVLELLGENTILIMAYNYLLNYIIRYLGKFITNNQNYFTPWYMICFSEICFFVFIILEKERLNKCKSSIEDLR